MTTIDKVTGSAFICLKELPNLHKNKTRWISTERTLKLDHLQQAHLLERAAFCPRWRRLQTRGRAALKQSPH